VFHFLKKAVDDASSDQRGKISAIYLLLFAINGAAWAWAVIALADRPTLLGTAVLAYVLGLRHAVDADHIASIDNVVRKLMQEGKKPVAVGLFFSLGHSLAIAAAVAGIAAAAFALEGRQGLFDKRRQRIRFRMRRRESILHAYGSQAVRHDFWNVRHSRLFS